MYAHFNYIIGFVFSERHIIHKTRKPKLTRKLFRKYFRFAFFMPLHMHFYFGFSSLFRIIKMMTGSVSKVLKLKAIFSANVKVSSVVSLSSSFFVHFFSLSDLQYSAFYHQPLFKFLSPIHFIYYYYVTEFLHHELSQKVYLNKNKSLSMFISCLHNISNYIAYVNIICASISSAK